MRRGRKNEDLWSSHEVTSVKDSRSMMAWVALAIGALTVSAGFLVAYFVDFGSEMAGRTARLTGTGFFFVAFLAFLAIGLLQRDGGGDELTRSGGEPSTPATGVAAERTTAGPATDDASAGNGSANATFDDFDAGPDPSRWAGQTDGTLLFMGGDVLNFRATGQAVEGYEELEAILPSGVVREISFTITLESYANNETGGAGIDVYLGDGTCPNPPNQVCADVSVAVGPGENGPGVEYLVCRTITVEQCDGDYDGYYSYQEGFPVKAETVIRIVWGQDKMDFYTGDQKVSEKFEVVPVTGGQPISGFRYFVYADSGSAFHVTVDDVRVVLAEQ